MEQIEKFKTGLAFDSFSEMIDNLIDHFAELNQSHVINFICETQPTPEIFDLERLQIVGIHRFGAIMGRLVCNSADREKGVIWINQKELEREFLKEIFYQVAWKNGGLKCFDNTESLEKERQIVAHVIKVFAMPYLKQEIERQVKKMQDRKD
ncbi:hypothetical protein HMPREF1430_00993 [Helicobacter pylori GAM96Ai]|uniref:hypothetical protein n=1 Tax=Helicobacter pylori TaxID=210 RepID=UPI0002BAF97D|nr:hypothetical protein [Helicobacter pylori]EMH42094.1 hypothetical protein HMPREF1430_00993 [Helicobacter pylori GAM96Ai]